MITKLRLHNWKSFEDSTIFIDPLTFLIGTNASGKSNVLDAFDFLRLDLSGARTENIVNQIRGGEDWIIRKGEDSAWLELTIEENGQEIQHKVEIRKSDNGLHRISDTSGISDDINALVEENINRVFILEPVPNRMRQYSKVSKVLQRDGGNIAGVLAALPEEEKRRVERELTEYIRPLPEQDINKIEAVTVGLTNSDAMLYCYEGWNPNEPVDARGMSDGTLRFAAIVVALLTVQPHSLLIIEEVDNGLHPSRAKELIKVLKKVSSERNVDVLCTTHNPTLIGELGNEMIPFISYVVRDEKGISQIRLLEEKDDLAKLMAAGNVGDLMIMDKL
jgi:predicted ATPase